VLNVESGRVDSSVLVVVKILSLGGVFVGVGVPAGDWELL
jgi:hypothetical protein